MNIIIDPGHAGFSLRRGYATPGKRSPKGTNGIIYEGVSNRAFAFNIAYLLSLEGVPAEVVNAATNDISLSDRVKNIDNIIGANNPKDYLLISIHSNSSPDINKASEWENATGMELFTSVGAPANTVGIARKLIQSISDDLKDVRWRTETTKALHKEKNFTIIKRTKCPAVLLEILFMDNIQDYNLLTSAEWRIKAEKAIAKALASVAKPF